ATLLASVAQDSEEEQLDAVRARIEKVKQQLAASINERDHMQGRLAEAERLVSELQNNIASLNRERAATESRLAELENRRQQALDDLQQQKSRLAEQVYAAYVGGRKEKIKLLLSQKDPAELGRVAVYYQYLNAQRLAKINAVRELVSTLEQLKAQSALENQTIKRLQRQRHVELEQLKSALQERQGSIAAINLRIRSSTDEVARLTAEEQKLVRLIEELDSIMKEFPVGSRTAFSKLKGELAWPVKGRLVADFGQRRNGSSISWDGVLIGAQRGTSVRAVARGRVAYADWLPGQGLLVIIEHGNDYFSLYGRNETVLAEPGDWVEPGEAIATIGDSGGQAQVALYFAIRKAGRPINPRPWFKGSVSRR
ncbi:MAG: peptidoglycan DD-metalloendopeptidase family protein, partial [Pseudomonadales bacterium]|nr:peptidoglycan DD-metalloendopeptidase family protein [Pseudomonadales bacterium]